MSAAQNGELILLRPDQQIFQKGDPGGDLFFIKEGRVQIYTTVKGEEISLTTMKEGDVLGLLTCLNHSPRMASARAVSEVRCIQVSKNQFEKQLASMPKWMGLVLKEFTIRLSQMDEKFAAQVRQIDNLKANQIDDLFICSQMADSMAIMGEHLSTDFEGQQVVFKDDLLKVCENLLSYDEKKLTELFEVFKKCSVVKIEKNPDNQKEYYLKEQGENLGWLANFIRASKLGKEKKMVQTTLPAKAKDMLVGFAELAQKREMNLDESIRFKVPELQEILQTVTGKEFIKDHIKICVNTGYIRQESKDDVLSIVFTPVVLLRTLASVFTVRTILNLDAPEASN